jgi:hypothetical protein
MVPMAADYPFLDVFWSHSHLLLLGHLDLVVITVLIDVFRRDDINGWVKALWVVFVVILPWLVVLIYLIAEHKGMQERSVQQAQQQKQAFDSYVREATGGSAERDRQGQGAARLGHDHQQEFDAAEGEGAGGQR